MSTTTPTLARYPDGTIIELHFAPTDDGPTSGGGDIQLAKVIESDDDSHLVEVIAEWYDDADLYEPPMFDNAGDQWSLFDKQITSGDVTVRILKPEDLLLSNLR